MKLYHSPIPAFPQSFKDSTKLEPKFAPKWLKATAQLRRCSGGFPGCFQLLRTVPFYSGGVPGCFVLFRRCSWLFRMCFVLSRRCSVLFWRCSVLFRRCSMLFRRCSVLFRRCSVLFRRCSWLFRAVLEVFRHVPVFRCSGLVFRVLVHALSCCYRSPNSGRNWLDKFNSFLAQCSSRYENILICGDFNPPKIDGKPGSDRKCRWSCIYRTIIWFIFNPAQQLIDKR